MSDFVITVNSTVDVPKEWLEERNVPVVPLKYTIDGETYEDMNGLSAKEFFQKLREGKMAVTSQVNPEEARAALEPFLKEGKDVLHLGFSSGLSGTCNSMMIAGEELKEDYPDRKVIVIDTLCACLGEALLLYYAVKLRDEGKTIEEVAQWAEENKLHICHDVTVDDLNHLQRGGRISKTVAFAGGVLNIKPVVTIEDGRVVLIGKARGSRQGNNLLVKKIQEAGGVDFTMPILLGYTGLDDRLMQQYIQDSRELWQDGTERLDSVCIGSVIGTYAGPGAVVAAFFRKGGK